MFSPLGNLSVAEQSILKYYKESFSNDFFIPLLASAVFELKMFKWRRY